jgi:hypothetical protein
MRRAEALASAARLRAGASPAPAPTDDGIDVASLDSIFSLLQQQNDALKALEVHSLRQFSVRLVPSVCLAVSAASISGLAPMDRAAFHTHFLVCLSVC